MSSAIITCPVDTNNALLPPAMIFLWAASLLGLDGLQTNHPILRVLQLGPLKLGHMMQQLLSLQMEPMHIFTDWIQWPQTVSTSRFRSCPDLTRMYEIVLCRRRRRPDRRAQARLRRGWQTSTPSSRSRPRRPGTAGGPQLWRRVDSWRVDLRNGTLARDSVHQMGETTCNGRRKEDPLRRSSKAGNEVTKYTSSKAPPPPHPFQKTMCNGQYVP